MTNYQRIGGLGLELVLELADSRTELNFAILSSCAFKVIKELHICII